MIERGWRTLHAVFQDKSAYLSSQRVCPEDGKLVWIVDRAAAGALSR
jgi:hypothetical protein